MPELGLGKRGDDHRCDRQDPAPQQMIAAGDVYAVECGGAEGGDVVGDLRVKLSVVFQDSVGENLDHEHQKIAQENAEREQKIRLLKPGGTHARGVR